MHAGMAVDLLWQLAGVSLEPSRLHDVSLVISRGVTAVLGWSGAGKSSLLNLLVAFEKPGAGELRGAPKIAWAPQDHGLWLHCTVREHLEIAHRSSHGIDALLAKFDLLEKAAMNPGSLSQGEQSRLAVARALAADAEVVVMDEPLAHVDPARSRKYWTVIREHLARTNASFVFATHEPEAVLGEAQRVICLRAGRLLHESAVAELYAHPPNAELMSFLGPGNWFEPEDALVWLNANGAPPRCVRPEQLVVEAAPDGAFEVEATRFQGTVAEVVLRANGSSPPRQFFHRPAHARLRPGQRVNLRLFIE
jgi:iron(III) transport system ATP-binding protein